MGALALLGAGVAVKLGLPAHLAQNGYSCCRASRMHQALRDGLHSGEPSVGAGADNPLPTNNDIEPAVEATKGGREEDAAFVSVPIRPSAPFPQGTAV